MSDLFIENWLINNYFWFSKLILFGCLFCLFFNYKSVAILFQKIDRGKWLTLFLIILFSFILRMWVVPHIHHVYFDEFKQSNIAQNMIYNGIFCNTLKGSNKVCEIGELEFWPPGYSAILAIVFSVFGDSEFVAYNFSALIGTA